VDTSSKGEKTIKTLLRNEKKTKLAALFSLVIVLSSVGIVFVYNAEIVNSQNNLTNIAPIMDNFNQTLVQIRQNTPTTSLNLKYSSSYPVFQIANNAINYTYGTVEISGLNDAAYYPSVLSVSFSVIQILKSGNATVTYSPQLLQQTINLTRGISIAAVPIGIPSVSVTGAEQNENITFLIQINAQVIWTSVNIIVATGNVVGEVKLQVTSGGDLPAPPVFGVMYANTTDKLSPVTLTMPITASLPISSCNIVWNNTGNWMNRPAIASNDGFLYFTGTWMNGDVVSVRFAVQDANGNYYNSPQYNFTLTQNPPITPTLSPTPTITPDMTESPTSSPAETSPTQTPKRPDL